MSRPSFKVWIVRRSACAENEAGDDQARENGREEEQGRW